MSGDEPQLPLFVPGFFNTTGERGETLKRYRRKARRQEVKVLSFFEREPGGHTPSEVHPLTLPEAPLTSVRRAITVLTKKRQLEKTGEKRRGPCGRPELVWRLREAGE